MADRNQAEEMIRAADRFTEAARELSGSLDQFYEFQKFLHQWSAEGHQTAPTNRPMPRGGMLSEEDAVALALRVAEEVRQERDSGLDLHPEAFLPAPTPDEVRQRRVERRKREAEAEDS